MSWLTLRYAPGFVIDLTSWTTTIERTGKLRQQVLAWPSKTTVTHLGTLRAADVAEIASLIASVDFAALEDPRRRDVVDDASAIAIHVKEGSLVRGFCAPLLWWDWAQHHGSRVGLPDLDFGPALDLWWAIDRLSPRHLAEIAMSANTDWRMNVDPAAAELRRLRSIGLDIGAALDHMRGRGFTLPAVSEAVTEVEGIAPAELHFLLESRGRWDAY
ncbi:hypothetical protein A7982_12581 [Minicystis rosea]|nr:hypothetical protein A7982_12581 [Minicystis rosea]